MANHKEKVTAVVAGENGTITVMTKHAGGKKNKSGQHTLVRKVRKGRMEIYSTSPKNFPEGLMKQIAKSMECIYPNGR